MKKLRQKLSCAASFGNTKVKITAVNRASLLPQIALHRHWKTI
jgi:hypothetical protein